MAEQAASVRRSESKRRVAALYPLIKVQSIKGINGVLHYIRSTS